jgi:predicted nucleic acid-binding protein
VDDLFVDTSAFYALANLADTHHAEAVAAFGSTVGHDNLKTRDHVVERLDIPRAFAFDKHFRIVRLGWRRHRTLEIVPH